PSSAPSTRPASFWPRLPDRRRTSGSWRRAARPSGLIRTGRSSSYCSPRTRPACPSPIRRPARTCPDPARGAPERHESARSPPAVSRSRKDEGGVAVAAPLQEHFPGVRQLVIDLEQIVVGVVEVDALLAHMIDGAGDLHAVIAQGVVGLPE